MVASTGGSVLNQVLQSEFFHSHLHSVIVDRECPAAEKAKAHGIATVRLIDGSPESFCNRLLEYLSEHDIDYIFSYYLDFYSGSFRAAYRDRIINFHPSLLPAFKGMDGFGDTVRFHAKFCGNTVEFVDQVMDEGKIIMQTSVPVDTTVPIEVVRHRLFEQQCQALLQVAKWLCEDRIVVEGSRVIVEGANFGSAAFAPALDFDDAIRLSVPMPVADRG